MKGNRKTFNRQQDILELLFRHDTGLSRAKIAQELGVDRSTITRDCLLLLEAGSIKEGEKRLLQLVVERFKFDVRLSVDEMQSLALACRSLAVNLRWKLPHASQALRKLAAAHIKTYPILSSQILETAKLMDEEVQNPRLANYVSLLSEAIERQRIVLVRYNSRGSDTRKEYRLLPGRLEPYASGHSLYLYALEPTEGQLRVLKVDRFQSLSVTTVKGTKEESDRLQELLLPERFTNSWGIWVSDKAPQKVILRFSSQVAGRVRETRWHPTQEIEDYIDSEGKKDGSVLWSAMISETKEMIPWVRGWGKDCEVISMGGVL